MSIAVVGSVFLDIKGYPLGAYLPGGRNAGRVEQVHGGVARNIAENIAGLGLRPVFVGLVDGTGAGADVLRRLEARGADVSHVRRTENGMGTWLAVFDDRGEVAASVSRRPDLSPIADILDEEGGVIFADADAVLTELDLEERVLGRVYALAEKRRVPVFAAVSNMSIAAERRAYLPRTDCFVCNRQEAAILFPETEGMPAPALPAALEGILRRERIPAVVVTLGAEGAVYASLRGERGFCPAMPAELRDAAGAGDAFFSGLSVALSRGQPLAAACRAGTAMAARVITVTENVCPPMTLAELGL